MNASSLLSIVGPAPLDKLEAFASMTQLAVSLSNRLVAGPRPADQRQPYSEARCYHHVFN